MCSVGARVKMHCDLARYLVLLVVVRVLVSAVLVTDPPAGPRYRRHDQHTAVTRHITDHRPSRLITSDRRQSPPTPAPPDRDSSAPRGRSAPGDLIPSRAGQPRARKATRRGRSGPRSRKRGCRGGQRWRACSRGRDEISICSININAIPQKILPLRHHLYRPQTDICIVQETWL